MPNSAVKPLILVVEDDPAVRNLIVAALEAHGLRHMAVETAHAAIAAASSQTPSIVLLDLGLPDMDGVTLIQKIRSWSNLPIIVISARSEDSDKLMGFACGADDYVTKPFRPQILGAKVKALIRRSKSFSQENSQQISCGPFLCDTTTMRFYKNNVELNLSEKERSLLLLFVRHPQQVFTKDMIYEQIWGNLIAVDDNAIMVYINRLRSKIEDNARTPQHIITIRGVGYRFVP